MGCDFHAGLGQSNGRLSPGLWLWSPVGSLPTDQDQLGTPCLIRIWKQLRLLLNQCHYSELVVSPRFTVQSRDSFHDDNLLPRIPVKFDSSV